MSADERKKLRAAMDAVDAQEEKDGRSSGVGGGSGVKKMPEDPCQWGMTIQQILMDSQLSIATVTIGRSL